MNMTRTAREAYTVLRKDYGFDIARVVRAKAEENARKHSSDTITLFDMQNAELFIIHSPMDEEEKQEAENFCKEADNLIISIFGKDS